MSINHCVSNLLKLIVLLQKNSTNTCTDLDFGCTKPFLGPMSIYPCFNTRVIQLYKCNGSLFTTTFINKENNTIESGYFRVESVHKNCCTLLILDYDSSADTYNTTQQYIMVNLNCIGAIRCLNDVYVSNL